VAVRGNLNAVRKTLREIIDKSNRGFRATVADAHPVRLKLPEITDAVSVTNA
jgi:hypothetical protein